MTKHKLFISYYHSDDEYYRDKFEELFRDFCRIIIPCLAESNLFEALGTKKLNKIFTNYYYSHTRIYN
jgi:hypothetical protein